MKPADHLPDNPDNRKASIVDDSDTDERNDRMIKF